MTGSTRSMKYKNKYRIKSIRLIGWDYGGDGGYFVTICAKDRRHFFGEIKRKRMILFGIGKIAKKFWYEIPDHFSFVILDEFCVMPNHLHGILFIKKVETQNLASVQDKQDFAPLKTVNLQKKNYKNKFGPQSKNLSSIIRGFKAGVKKYATMNKIEFFWQPRFYDRIIRNEEELSRIRKYIFENHLKWALNKDNKF